MLEARLGQKDGTALLSQLALADVRVTVDVRAERRLRVVEVQRADPLDTDELRALVERRGEGRLRADLMARREQMAGVQAQAQLTIAA